MPTLSANAQERITNATGFTGRTSAYTMQGMLSWRLDYSAYSTAQAQASAADVQKVRAERARRGVEDDIFDAWERVRTGIVKSASARAQAEAALRAEELALARYQSGALTQLDVTQSQRDAFQAQASRIQADADLLYSRVVLRLAAGKSPHVEPSALPPFRPKTSTRSRLRPATVPRHRALSPPRPPLYPHPHPPLRRHPVERHVHHTPPLFPRFAGLTLSATLVVHPCCAPGCKRKTDAAPRRPRRPLRSSPTR